MITVISSTKLVLHNFAGQLSYFSALANLTVTFVRRWNLFILQVIKRAAIKQDVFKLLKTNLILIRAKINGNLVFVHRKRSTNVAVKNLIDGSFCTDIGLSHGFSASFVHN